MNRACQDSKNTHHKIYIYVCFKQSSGSLPEAAVDNEEDGNEEGGHLAGVDEGVRPGEEERKKHQREREREKRRKCLLMSAKSDVKRSLPVQLLFKKLTLFYSATEIKNKEMTKSHRNYINYNDVVVKKREQQESHHSCKQAFLSRQSFKCNFKRVL